MIIVASRRDDILRRKSEYEADRAIRQERYDTQYRKYYDAQQSIYNEIESIIEDSLSNVNLNMDIRVRSSFGTRESIEVMVSDENNKFDEDKAIAWTWKAYLDKDGNVKKESNSWSGFNAVSDANIAYLEEVLKAVKILNNTDWSTLLSRQLPEWGDYITEDNPRYDRNVPNFDRELLEADIEDIIGTNTGVLCDAESSKFYRGQVYRFIVSQTPAQYTVFDIPKIYVDNGDVDISKYNSYTYRISKSKFFDYLIKPLKTVEV